MSSRELSAESTLTILEKFLADNVDIAEKGDPKDEVIRVFVLPKQELLWKVVRHVELLKSEEQAPWIERILRCRDSFDKLFAFMDTREQCRTLKNLRKTQEMMEERRKKQCEMELKSILKSSHSIGSDSSTDEEEEPKTAGGSKPDPSSDDVDDDDDDVDDDDDTDDDDTNPSSDDTLDDDNTEDDGGSDNEFSHMRMSERLEASAERKAERYYQRHGTWHGKDIMSFM